MPACFTRFVLAIVSVSCGLLQSTNGLAANTVIHAGHLIAEPGKPEAQRALQRAARWALTCRNADGGFSHFPGGTSDADAVYFQVGTLVLAGYLQPVDPLPKDPQLLGWGHLFPPPAQE